MRRGLVVGLALAAGLGVGCKIEGATFYGYVRVTPTSWTLAPGDTVRLHAVVKSTEGVPLGSGVTWSSSRPAVAAVDAEGLVSGVSVGKAEISAVGPGTTTGSATITVVPP